MFFLNSLVQLVRRENGDHQMDIEADAGHTLGGSKGYEIPAAKINDVGFEHLQKQ